MKTQVPDALSRCVQEDREDLEVEDDIPTFEASAVMFMRSQAKARGTTEGIKEEEVNPYDLWDELDDDERIDIAEDPVPILIREVLDAQKTDRFCRDILSGSGQTGGKFIETDDGGTETNTPERGRQPTDSNPGGTPTTVAQPNPSFEDPRAPRPEKDVWEAPETLILAVNGGRRCIDG